MEGKGGSNFLWFLCGAGTGLAVALLFAPEPGEEMRDRLAAPVLVAEARQRDRQLGRADAGDLDPELGRCGGGDCGEAGHRQGQDGSSFHAHGRD